MLDTMTFTKIIGSFCGALLIYLLGNWAAESFYHVGDHGHGEKHAYGYAIEVEEDDIVDDLEDQEDQIDFAALMEVADVSKGAKVWGKCKACHKLEDGANATGPHLYAVVDREVGSVSGYNYSGALVKVTDVWDIDSLNGFLENPKILIFLKKTHRCKLKEEFMVKLKMSTKTQSICQYYLLIYQMIISKYLLSIQKY